MRKKLVNIQLFPIGITILPKDVVPFHIFEERYKKMVSNCIKDNTEFGIVYKLPNKKFVNIGCSVKIDKVYKKYEDGRYDIILRGMKRFRIVSSKKYDDIWHSEISYIDEKYDSFDKKYFAKIHDKYLKLLILLNKKNNFQTEMDKKVSFDFTKNILLPNQIKQDIIGLSDEEKRLRYIDNFLTELLNDSQIKYNKEIDYNLS
tara:strand:- start:12920 stop:13528 length:609 start_codon:yes stop_codon:yes gene_type:complete